MTREPAARAPWRETLLALAACEAVAVALWLLPASVRIVQWPASGPVRLALMLPTWQLAVALGAGAITCGVLALTGRAARWRPALSPLTLLWALAVPFLPWVPDRVPLLLVLAGPLKWLVIGTAVVRAVMASRGVRAWLAARPLPGRRAVFGVSLVIYLGLGLYSVSTNGLGGDEPHYLVITESLLRDGDLQIENNHQRRDYRSFFRGELRPDFMKRGLNGQIYSIHAPGLPAVLLPAYAVAGHYGAVALLACLAALAALAIFDLAEYLAGRAAALLTWAAVCLTVPFVPHSWSIFPEMPGALLVAWGVSWLWRGRSDETSPAWWLVRGGVLAWLPWLHTKFIVFLALLSLGFGLRLLRTPARLVAVGLPIAVSTALWFYSFYAIYGSWSPEAPYGAYSAVYVLNRNIPHGLVGLLFDQKFGLLVFSPVYLAALAGILIAVRQRGHRLAAVVLIAIVAAFVVSTARLYMFWGGSSAPARFFVPVLPCLAPFIALAIARSTRPASRALVGLAVLIGIGTAVVGLADPGDLMLYSDPHGRSRVLEWMQAGSPLSLVVPTFTEPTWASQLGGLMLWGLAGLLGVVPAVAWWRSTQVSAWTVGATTATLFLIAGGVLTAHPSADVREATARRGALDTLWAFDGARFRTLDYSAVARVSPERLRDLTTLHLAPATPARAGDPMEVGPLQLPPGAFDVEVWFSSTRAREGEISVAEPRATFGRIVGPLANPATFSIDVPAQTRRAMVRVVDPQVAVAVTEIRLRPRAIVPPPARDPRPARLIESLPGPLGRYLVYTDGEAYPELGTFWSRGTAETTVLLAPAGASRATLTLSTGPMAGDVEVSVGAEPRTVPMRANESQAVTFALPGGQSLVPVRIRSSVMFRPSEVNPASGDSRGLGCQVVFALE